MRPQWICVWRTKQKKYYSRTLQNDKKIFFKMILCFLFFLFVYWLSLQHISLTFPLEIHQSQGFRYQFWSLQTNYSYLWLASYVGTKVPSGCSSIEQWHGMNVSEERVIPFCWFLLNAFSCNGRICCCWVSITFTRVF
jgi:hypothetical protein